MRTQFGEHDIAIACLTVEEMPVPHEAGSDVHQCVECDTAVWCGPSTIIGIVMRHPSARLLFMCCDCIVIAHRANATTAAFEVLPEQLAAIRKWEAGRGPK